MGISGLRKFLQKHCPEVFETIHISKYAYKKVAVDTSLFMNKYKKSLGPERWLAAFISLVCCLRKNNLHPVFVYDTGSPKEKEEERRKRKDSNAKAEEKMFDIGDDIDIYYRTGEVTKALYDLFIKIITKLKKEQPQKRLLKPIKELSSINSEPVFNIKIVENEYEKLKKQTLSTTKEDFIITKNLFKILKIPYIDAIMEAETLCSDLCNRGFVDLVLSDDSDIIAYGCESFVSKLNTSSGECTLINYNNIIKSLQITGKTFLDFCIMCGTDYNLNIPGIGPEKAWKLISEHDDIDGIKKNTDLDVTILNHVRSRELFNDYEKFKDPDIAFCSSAINFAELDEFFEKNNIKVDVSIVKNAFTVNEQKLVFED